MSYRITPKDIKTKQKVKIPGLGERDVESDALLLKKGNKSFKDLIKSIKPIFPTPEQHVAI